MALWESNYIWPKANVDLVLSVGTGTGLDDEPASPSTCPEPGGVWKDGFLPRLFRSFMASLDGQKTWTELVNRLHPELRGSYFRLNVQFQGSEPQIDDVTQFDSMRASVAEQKSDCAMGVIADKLAASLFFFELDAVPGANLRCTGHILCRTGGSDDSFRSVREYIRKGDGRFLVGNKVITSANKLLDIEGGFRLPVAFTTKSLNGRFSIMLALNNRPATKISGFPTSVSALVIMQGLDSPFGHANHRTKPIRQPCQDVEDQELEWTATTVVDTCRKRKQSLSCLTRHTDKGNHKRVQFSYT